MLNFSLDFRVVNKFKTNNENLPKQCTYSIHVNEIKCTLHSKEQVLKKDRQMNHWKKSIFVFISLG